MHQYSFHFQYVEQLEDYLLLLYLLHLIITIFKLWNIGYLLSQGATIENKTNKGFTPLHIASQQDHIIIVEYVFLHGANIESKNKKWFYSITYFITKNGAFLSNTTPFYMYIVLLVIQKFSAHAPWSTPLRYRNKEMRPRNC